MRNKIISILLFLLFFILYSRFFIPSSVHASTTTLYFGPIEKTYDDSGRVVEEKVYYPAGSVTAVKTVNSEQETVNTNYLHSDHLGSTVLVTGENGDKKEENIYYPYGRQLTVNSEQLTTNPQLTTNNLQPTTDRLYTGQRLDSSSDLYFYNARYYNPTIGHFISADKAEGPNRYAYVGNNPVMRNDPSGNMIAETDKDYKGSMYENTYWKSFWKSLILAQDIQKKYGVNMKVPVFSITDNKPPWRDEWEWRSNELEIVQWGMEKMIKNTNNPKLLEGITIEREPSWVCYLCHGRLGSADISNKIIEITGLNFHEETGIESKRTIIHEALHILDPGFQNSKKWDEFADVLKQDGVDFYKSFRANSIDPDNHKRVLSYNSAKITKDNFNPVSSYSLTYISEAYAEFGSAYFAPDTFKYVMSNSAIKKIINYDIGDINKFKDLYPNAYEYFYSVYGNNK